MNQPDDAARLVQTGRRALESADWSELRDINQRLLNLLPRDVQEAVKAGKIGF